MGYDSIPRHTIQWSIQEWNVIPYKSIFVHRSAQNIEPTLLFGVTSGKNDRNRLWNKANNRKFFQFSQKKWNLEFNFATINPDNSEMSSSHDVNYLCYYWNSSTEAWSQNHRSIRRKISQDFFLNPSIYWSGIAHVLVLAQTISPALIYPSPLARPGLLMRKTNHSFTTLC